MTPFDAADPVWGRPASFSPVAVMMYVDRPCEHPWWVRLWDRLRGEGHDPAHGEIVEHIRPAPPRYKHPYSDPERAIGLSFTADGRFRVEGEERAMDGNR